MENQDEILEELLKEGDHRAKPKHCYNRQCRVNISTYCKFGHNYARICMDRIDEEN
ncbi:MAG: hypothetical protein ACFFCI_02310 [Promethearchaeota archaeon]